MTIAALQATMNAPGRKLTVYYLGEHSKFFAAISRNGVREAAATATTLEDAVVAALHKTTEPKEASL